MSTIVDVRRLKVKARSCQRHSEGNVLSVHQKSNPSTGQHREKLWQFHVLSNSRTRNPITF